MTLLAYKSVRRATLIEGTSPHQLIKMLYDGALSNIAIARQHLTNQNSQLLHAHIDKTIAIVQELQGSLRDHETNELAGNLFDLYSYIVSRLLESNKTMDDKGLSECANLVGILRDAWQGITPEQMAAA